MDTGADSIRFAGLMSRCMMPAEWQYLSDFINCENDPNSSLYTVAKELSQQYQTKYAPRKYTRSARKAKHQRDTENDRNIKHMSM